MPRLKKKDPPPPPRKGLLGNADDYNVYRFNPSEFLLYTLEGFLAGAVVSLIFYENLILSAIVAVACGILYPRFHKKHLIARRKNKLLLQFRDCLESFSTSLSSGANVPQSFEAVAADMAMQHGPASDISRETSIIVEGIADNFNVEHLLADFGVRSGLPDIKNFSDVFEICYRKGGNVREIVKSTYQIICDKVDVQLEINTAVASKRIEQNAMLVMPVVFIFLLKLMGSDMINLHSIEGILSTTVGLACFIGAYFIGKRILKIDL